MSEATVSACGGVVAGQVAGSLRRVAQVSKPNNPFPVERRDRRVEDREQDAAN